MLDYQRIVFFARAFRQHRYTLLQYIRSQAVMQIAIRTRLAPYNHEKHGDYAYFTPKTDDSNSVNPFV